MARKEIYAALEIADHEVRLVVGEMFDSRLNILRVERAAGGGVEKREINDEKAVVAAIRKAAADASAALGCRIERVLLAIPSKRVTRVNQKVNVTIDDGTRTVRLFHIQSGYNKAITYRAADDLVLVNAGCIKYKVNGITSRKLPLGENCESFVMDMDLLYADKKTVYDYARCVELANLEIMDICLDSYAMAQEAAVFEQAIDRYIVQVDLSRSDTVLTLFAHGRLVRCIRVDEGYAHWYEELQRRFHLKDSACFRLLQNLFSADPQQNGDNVIYIESIDGQQVQVTAADVFSCCMERMHAWVRTISETCELIVRGGTTRYVVSGEGMDIQVLGELMKEFNAPSSAYVPQLIGARQAAFTTTVGMIYNWKEIQQIRKDGRISVNHNEMEESVESINKVAHDGEGGFTRKLRSILLSDR